jgi:serine/threonine protein kinase
MIAFPCPQCKATLKAPEEKIGAYSKCRWCGCAVQVPAPPAPTAANTQPPVVRFRLLKCVSKALAKHGVRFLMNLVPGGDVIYDIAADTWEDYHRDGQHDALRADLQALAQASPAEVRTAVAEAVKETAGEQPATIRDAMTNYLTQVPAAIRRSLRRPSDPTGTTFAAGETLRGADDLVQFLPARQPRFKPGDRPLPGVDLELEELVGVGGFGEVWRAHNPNMRNQPPVALKFCLDKSATFALRNEAGVLDRVMKAGRHPGIVRLLQTYLSADPPFLAYEYVEGGDLAGLIREMHGHGHVKPDVVNRLVLRLAEIVAFAHQASPPIVHGDLKPANVLVRRHPDRKVGLRITDFGIGGLAAVLSADHKQPQSHSRQELLTAAVRGAYTPLYASPQQRARRPGETADPRDDIHALGVIWFQMLNGDLGMTGIPTDWREQAKERGLSDALIDLLGRCFSPKSEKRPDNASVLADQMRAALAPAASANPSLAASPPADDGLIVLQLADESAAVPPKHQNGDIRAHGRPPTTTRSWPRPVPATRRSEGGEQAHAEQRPRHRAGRKFAAFVGAGVAALLTLVLLCAGAAGLLWPGFRTVENPVLIGNAPPVKAPEDEADKIAGEQKMKQEAEALAKKNKETQALADLMKKEEADKLLAEQKKRDAAAELARIADTEKQQLAEQKKREAEAELAKKEEAEKQRLADLKKTEEAEILLAEKKMKEMDAKAELAKKEEAEKQRLADLKAKENDPEAAKKKVVQAVEDATMKLAAKSPNLRKVGIATLAKLGADAASADYELCRVIAFDPVPDLRRAALDALEMVQPRLHSSVVTLTLPVEMNSPGGYKKAIATLPGFGRAGIPLMAAQLQGKNPHVADLSVRFPAACTVILDAHIDALANIAPDHDAALSLLLTVPESPLAMVTEQGRQIDGAYLDAHLRTQIAEKAVMLGKQKPELRQKIVPFLINLAQLDGGRKATVGSAYIKARLTGINALAAFGSDANSALQVLNKMKLDPSEEVRNAVRQAIAKIDKAG